MQSGMASDPLFDLAAAMDGSPIPQQDHWPPKMPEQVFKECSDIQPCEIAGAKIEIEGQSSPLGGHGQGADRRDSILFVEIVNDGRRSFWGPSAGHVGDEQETGFIEEDQMGAKTLSVFLYAASGTASSGRWPLRPVAGPDAPVSDSSIRGFPGVSRRGKDGRPRPNAVGSSRRHALRSTGPSDSRPPGSPSGAMSPVASSVTGRAWADGPEWLGAEDPGALFSGTSDPTGTPNSRTRSLRAPQPTDSCPLLATGWPVGVAAPVAGRFLEVSCLLV